MSSDESKATPGEETLAPSTPTSGGLTSASRGTRVSAIRPGARIAHYRIDRHLGAGGMGEVFAAWDLALDRAAAIKVIRPGFAASFTGRLLREVDACARLQHPAIATFFEGGEYQGRTYFAMELVNGTTLRERLSAGRIATRDGLAIASGVLEGLAHAHEAGILHRDIKPDNIVLTPRGVPKLLDFGLARCLFQGEIEGEADCDPATITNLTAHGSIPGTPGYMSPEQ